MIKYLFPSTMYSRSKLKLQLLAISRILLFGSLFVHYLLWLGVSPKFFPNSNYPEISNALYYFFLISVIISSLLCALGIFSQYFSALVFVTHLYFVETNIRSFWGWGLATVFIIFLHFFSPNNLFFTLRKQKSIFKSFLPLYFLIAFASLVYLTTNLLRLDKTDWHNGNVLMYIFLDPMFSRWPQFNYFKLEYLLVAANHFGWAAEFLGIFLFLIPKKKVRFFISVNLICLHLLLLAVSKLQIWSPVMISLLVLSWADYEWDRGIKKSTAAVIGLVVCFFATFSFYSYEIGVKGKNDGDTFLLKTLHNLKFDGLRYDYLFKTSPHRMGLIYQVYSLGPEGRLKKVFETNSEKYLGVNSAFLFEPYTEFIERISLFSDETTEVCQALNSLFESNSNAFFIRKVSLHHFAEAGVKIYYSDLLKNCSRFEAPIVVPPKFEMDYYKDFFYPRIKMLGLKY